MNQRMLAVPDETQHIWKLDSPLKEVPWPGSRWLRVRVRVRVRINPPIWDLVDLQPTVEALQERGCGCEKRL
jgi:hypothetical protein